MLWFVLSCEYVTKFYCCLWADLISVLQVCSGHPLKRFVWRLEEKKSGYSRRFQKLPSSSSLVMVRVAEHAASPALLVALQVYCPACSLKASTMMSVAVFVTSSKWNTTFLVGWTGCRLWNQLISGFGMPDTHVWKRATSPCGTEQLVIGWMKTGFWPMEGFFRLVETCHWGSAGLSTVDFCPERKHVHWLCQLHLIYTHPSQHCSADFQVERSLGLVEKRLPSVQKIQDRFLENLTGRRCGSITRV